MREKIAREIGQHAENCAWGVCSKSEQDAAFRSADFILALIKEAGYVRLIDDQSLPENPFNSQISALELSAYNGFQLALVKMRGWRKVIQEANNDR